MHSIFHTTNMVKEVWEEVTFQGFHTLSHGTGYKNMGTTIPMDFYGFQLGGTAAQWGKGRGDRGVLTKCAKLPHSAQLGILAY